MGERHLHGVGFRGGHADRLQRVHVEPVGDCRGVFVQRGFVHGGPALPVALDLRSAPAALPVLRAVLPRPLLHQPPDADRGGDGHRGGHCGRRLPPGAEPVSGQQHRLLVRVDPDEAGYSYGFGGEPCGVRDLQYRGHRLVPGLPGVLVANGGRQRADRSRPLTGGLPRLAAGGGVRRGDADADGGHTQLPPSR